MAKQKGLAKFAGKIDEQSFYYSKNGGYQSRKINPGMSARVKTAPEYANTRLNNAEFGGAGSCAGAMVSGITSRWRFILDSIATGKLVNRIKAAMLLDTTSAWGKRKLQVADMPAIQDFFNRLSKNALPVEMSNFVKNSLKYDLGGVQVYNTVTMDLSAETCQEYLAKGATGVMTKAFAYQVNTPTPLVGENKYIPCTSNIVELDGYSVDNPITASGVPVFFDTVEESTAIAPKNSATEFGGVLMVVLPYKTIGSQKYILQELCSAYWSEIETQDL